MKALLLFLTFVHVLVGTVHCSLAPFIRPCYAEDRACLKSSAQAAVAVVAAGLPALGVERMDPMHLEHVSANQAGLIMEFNNTQVRGLRHCRVLDLQREGPRMSVELQCSVVLTGDYVLSGKLLIFRIQGSGRYKITIRDIVVKVSLETVERKKGRERYWSVVRWRHTAHVLTSVVYHFQNLFNGDEALARPVTQFANKNWRAIFTEVSPPIVSAIVDRIVHQTAHLFEKVPLTQLSLD
ncbi:protein takeout-like isoform X1 [Pieris napi]|uniref:protein takeout-like isoform X1 n=1 Tax=Pieris napi TaxID=78633 RepID=UPI001FB92B31|nr:protein takeout-like isoform X1 [Pieris napi]